VEVGSGGGGVCGGQVLVQLATAVREPLESR
jgi:hypothetical protein